MSVESLQRCRHLMNADAIYPSFLPGRPSCQMMAFICLPPPSSANVSLKTRHLFVRRTVFNWSVRGSIIPFWRSGATTMSSSFFFFFVCFFISCTGGDGTCRGRKQKRCLQSDKPVCAGSSVHISCTPDCQIQTWKYCLSWTPCRADWRTHYLSWSGQAFVHAHDGNVFWKISTVRSLGTSIVRYSGAIRFNVSFDDLLIKLENVTLGLCAWQ